MGSSLPNTKPTKNIPQQIVIGDLAGDLGDPGAHRDQVEAHHVQLAGALGPEEVGQAQEPVALLAREGEPRLVQGAICTAEGRREETAEALGPVDQGGGLRTLSMRLPPSGLPRGRSTTSR